MCCARTIQQWLLTAGGSSGWVIRLGIRLTIGLRVLASLELLTDWRQLCVPGLGKNLLGPKLRVFALGSNQFIVRAMLGNLTFVNHDNTVGVDDG